MVAVFWKFVVKDFSFGRIVQLIVDISVNEQPVDVANIKVTLVPGESARAFEVRINDDFLCLHQ